MKVKTIVKECSMKAEEANIKFGGLQLSSGQYEQMAKWVMEKTRLIISFTEDAGLFAKDNHKTE